MRRAVPDSNVLVSALIAPDGPPAAMVHAMRSGELELIVSPRLLGELGGVLKREKFRRYIDLDAVGEFLDMLRSEATVVADPEGPPPLRCDDPDDDYLIALAQRERAHLVSGDGHLLALAGTAPVLTAAEFLAD